MGALAVTFRDVWTDGRRLYAIGTIVASGNYVNNGDDLNIKAASPSAKGHRWMANSDPDYIDIKGKAGYFYEYDRANKKMITRQGDNTNAAAAPFIQLPVAAYPAGVTGDTIEFFAVGKKLV